MNVYINKGLPPYGAGLIIVAANSIHEAHALAMNYNDYIAYLDIYLYDDWKLVEGLVYNGPKPKVIEENNYVE